MVKAVFKRVKPKHGFAHLLHLGLIAVVPPLAYIFVRLDFFTIAIAIVLLSKWRMFAVRPRHWLAHIRTNSVDIITSLGFVIFMIAANGSMFWQLWWLVAYEIWVLYFKPGTSAFLISAQAFIAQFVGLTALFVAYDSAPASVFVLGAGAISYFVARHFFGAFEEGHVIQYSWLWSFFSASLVWILSHWLLFYGPLPQPVVLIGVIGYGLAGLYFLHEHDKLTQMVRRQIMFAVTVTVLVILIFSNWGDGVIK